MSLLSRSLLLALSLLPFWGALSCARAGAAGTAPDHGDHIVIVVWDGLRPDLISQTDTPALFRLAHEGVFFAQHHPVYPSSTEVNGVALATGDFPDHTTVLANKEYRPALDPAAPIGTESLAAIRKGDVLTGGKYLPVPTIEELLQRAGFPTLVAGTKPVAVLPDRAMDEVRQGPAATTAARASIDLAQGRTLPASALPALEAALGPFPETVTYPNVGQDNWTTQALTEVLWKKGVPPFTVLWLSDPDYTQHQSSPGSEKGLMALKASDLHLAQVLTALTRKGLRDRTDVIVVSDHGFSSLSRSVDVAALLQKAGFDAVRRFAGGPKARQVLVLSLGGSDFLYVPDHDAAIVARLAVFFQKSDFAGVIFTKAGLPGTFPLNAVRLASSGNADAPDLVVSFCWTAEPNRSGTPGRLIGDFDASFLASPAFHASLSRFDMHNACVASGPDFKRGWVDALPTGNIDLAPTVAWLLRIPNPPPMDGRILTEALRQPPADAPSPQVEERKLTADLPPPADGSPAWSQYLLIKTVNGTTYIEEGNGGTTP